jgi:hypothetical protein
MTAELRTQNVHFGMETKRSARREGCRADRRLAEKLAEMSQRAQAWKLNRRTTLTLAELAGAINPVMAHASSRSGSSEPAGRDEL